ncbi:hypothetical protein V6N12_062559 [Hibiscus sabdariffa]|uniref:Cytochrome P450 n=1 Tax=Hibiscus sabdariffa TaxID=183260 RepID=A0ABR2F9B3_9ROSI
MMDSSLLNIVLVTAILVCITLLIYNKSKLLHSLRSILNSSETIWHKLPLGSMGWPFVGETIQFISCAYSDRPESFMDCRRRMYGKVFKSHIFGAPTIVSTDSDVNRFVLQSDAKAFVPFYPKSLTELMGKSSILLINGSLQRKIHGLVGSFFKSPLLKHQITNDMQNYVQISMDKWREDRPIYIQDETKNIAFQVLVKALISLNPGPEMEILKKEFQEFMLGLMSLPVKVPGSQLYRSSQAKTRMVKIVHNIIRSKRKTGDMSRVPKDVVDVLVKDASEVLTDDLIAGNMIDMMIPGEDSVPLLMTLAIKYLSDCPAALHQLTEENMKLKMLKDKNGEPLIWTDYLSLSFTQSDKDIINSYNFTPFGGGQRLCPGLDLAKLEASIFLHHFVTSFRWVAQDDTIVNFPTVRMKSRMPVWVKRRQE